MKNVIISIICAVYAMAPTRTDDTVDNSTYECYSNVVPVVYAKRLDPNVVKDIACIVVAEGTNTTDDYAAIAHVVIVRSRAKGLSIFTTIRADGQFDGYGTKHWKNAPEHPYYEQAREAAISALDGDTYNIYPYNLYFFHNPDVSTDTKWVRYISRYSIGKIGRHEFCINNKIDFNG